MLSFAISCCFCTYKKTVIQIQCAFFPVLSFSNTCLQIDELFFFFFQHFFFLIFLLFFTQCCLSFSSSGRCCCEKIKHAECREVCEQVSVDVSLHFHYFFPFCLSHLANNIVAIFFLVFIIDFDLREVYKMNELINECCFVRHRLCCKRVCNAKTRTPYFIF